MKRATLLLQGYFTKGSTLKKTYRGKEYEIERYQGEHANEYCVFEMRNGVRDGSAELFEDGMVKMRWRMANGVRDGFYVLFNKGVAVERGKWSDIDNTEEKVIRNRRSGLTMMVRVNDMIVYEGGYNESMQRDGLGYEYENGQLKRYGRWEKDELVEIEQWFKDGSEMIEYTKGCTSDPLSHKPVYIGGYQWDEESGRMKRNGAGRYLNAQTGVCEYESEWENGMEIESKRVLLYDGWYSQYTNEESSRAAVDGVQSLLLGPRVLVLNTQMDEALSIDNNDFNDIGVDELSLNGLTCMKRIVIGADCFGTIRRFKIDGLGELESVVIGKNCFTHSKSKDKVWNGTQNDGSFGITDCPKLESIQIGDYSFADVHSCELSSLPALQSIEMGENCFAKAPSFSLTGLISSFYLVNRSPSAIICCTGNICIPVYSIHRV